MKVDKSQIIELPRYYHYLKEKEKWSLRAARLNKTS